MSEKNEINSENKTPKSKTPAMDRLRDIFNSPEEIEILKTRIEALYEEHEDRIAAIEKQLKDLGLPNANLS